MAVDSDEGARVESSAGAELAAYEGDTVLEPYEGMEFESEDSAKIFYDEYARRLGFVMRVMSCRRSERDGKILARRLGCNKEGHCVSIRGKFGPVRKPRPSTREGCKAMIHVKYDKSGKWVITKFVKDHNHPLVVSPREARQTMVSFLISYIIFCCSIFTILSLHYLFNKSISLLWVYLLLHIHYNDYLCCPLNVLDHILYIWAYTIFSPQCIYCVLIFKKNWGH